MDIRGPIRQKSIFFPEHYMLHEIVVEPVKDEERFQRQPHHLTENTLGRQSRNSEFLTWCAIIADFY